MYKIFLSHGSTDHEDVLPRAFITAKGLAEHLLTVAGDNNEIIVDADANAVRMTVNELEQRLLEGRTLYVGEDDTLEIGCAIVLESDSNECAVQAFTQCSSMMLSEGYVGNVENEDSEATDAYLAATTQAEREAVLAEYGDTLIFKWVDEDGDTLFDMTLEQMARATRVDNSCEWAVEMGDGDGNLIDSLCTFQLQVAL